MKTLFSILGLLSSILAFILAVLPTEKIAIIPAILAILFALIAFFLDKKGIHKLLKVVLAISFISLLVITYKILFSETKTVTEDQEFIEQTEETEKKALEELEDLPELDNFEETTDSIQ